jgi:hypothetical protein
MQQPIYAYGMTTTTLNQHEQIELDLNEDHIDPEEAAFLHGYYADIEDSM